MEWLAAIERTAAADALRTSFHLYPVVNALHILAIGALATTVLLMHARSAGLFAGLDEARFHNAFRRIALSAFVVAVATGLALFSVKAVEYAANPAFLLKIGLIGAAMVNFGLWLALPAWRRAGTLLSALLWPAILLAGRYIAFV